MTARKILFSDGSSAYMTYEQIVEQFEKMINKVTNQVVYVAPSSKLEFDDVKQEMLVATWKAFYKYDPSSGYSFSTYLFHWLRHAKSKVITSETREKRNGMKEYSMNNQVGDGEDGPADFMNYLPAEDGDVEDFEFNYNYNIIKNELNEKEQKMLEVLIVEDSMSGEDLAKEWGVSRQAVNKRLIKLRKKIQHIMLEKDLLSGTSWESKVSFD